MKAEDDISLIQNFKEMYVDEKLDGVRVWAEIRKKTVVAFRTYEFREIDINCLQNLKSQIEDLIKPFNVFESLMGDEGLAIFVDGELTGKDRQSVSGQVNKILKGTASVDIDKDFIYHIFDIDQLSTLENGKGTWIYSDRKSTLDGLFHGKDYPNIKLVVSTLCSNEDEMYEIYNAIVAKGGEGVVIKSGDHVYETKRSKYWIKMKEVNECDLRVVGTYEGKGKRSDKNVIGGFICKSDDDKIKVDVGSGFSDELLKEVSNNLDNYIGKIVSVKYNVKIKSKDGDTWSLFLPRLSEIRIDKTETDVFEKIK
jgi:ATP-dependent DNA ligase